MFGMNDPAQTLLQLERYVDEGRMEMSEVMAIQFTEMFLADKKRDVDAQIMLVKGLRILCDVFLVREKPARAISTVKILHRERKKLTRILSNDAPQLLEKMTPAADDYRRAGNIYAAAGKKRAATKAFSRCEKLSRGHVASALDACKVLPINKKLVTRLISAVNMSGPVIYANAHFFVEPEHSPRTPLEDILSVLQKATEIGIGPKDSCLQLIQRLQEEKTAIERGEAAANARLQAAMDLLKPQHDYYEY